MSRDIPGDLATAIDAPVVRPFLAVFIDLPDPVRAWTGIGMLTFEGHDYIGAGGVGSIDTVGESTDGSAVGIKVGLYQIPSDFREDIADQAMRGATFEVYVGSVDQNFTTVDAVQMIWRGRVDQYTITDAGTGINVEITGESRAIDQRRPTIRRFTDEWQKRRYPTDRFFEYLPQMSEVSVMWAAADQTAPSGGGGGGGGSGGGGVISPNFN